MRSEVKYWERVSDLECMKRERGVKRERDANSKIHRDSSKYR